MSELLRRLRWLFRRGQFERELDEEMQHHLAMKAEAGDENAFGNVVALKEESREKWSFTFWEQLWQDVRYGARSLWKNKLFTSMAVLSLALGIGANTAIYSFMDAILLRSLPVQHAEELAAVNWQAKRSRIVRMVMGEAIAISAGGVAVGLAASWGAGQFVESLLFGVKARDPLAMSLAVVVLMGAALLAGYAPARRASRIEPMEALRHE